MCGIAGIIRLRERPLPPPEVAQSMAAAIVHRGPDSFGEYRDGDVHLTAVRLSILDLERGDQPVLNEAKDVAAVYNGELYNFPALAAELRLLGYVLPSSGDTVVLPYLYGEHRTEMVHKLRGMYAFAIWDRSNRRLMLCRDRLGIKPLYIARTSDFLLFGSEIKAILASGLVDGEIDIDSLDDLFSISYPVPPRTMFRGIEELLPAHKIVISLPAGEMRCERYWRVPFVPYGRHARFGRRDAAAELLERLRQRVKDHMIADVMVGTYLSGGIDSSAITALIREVSPEAFESFTIAFPGESLDEGPSAAKLARRFGFGHHRVDCGPDTAELFPESIYHTELPLQYPLAMSFIRLATAVRERGIKVILTGEGADEQLAGYDCFRLERVRRVLDRPGLRGLKPLVYQRMFQWLGSPQGMADFFITVQSRPNQEIEQEFGGVRPPWYDVWHALDIDRRALLAVGGRTARRIEGAPSGFATLVREDIAELHPLDAALAVELETRLPSWTVLVDDRSAMARGVETRVPFLDHELVEWIAALPPAFKLRGLQEKSVLRDAMKGILPPTVRARKKRPFYSPIKEWFFSDRRPEFVDELLSVQALEETSMFVPSVVESLRARLRQTPDNSLLRHRLEWLLILVLGTQVLHDRFIKGSRRLTDPGARAVLKGMRQVSYHY